MMFNVENFTDNGADYNTADHHHCAAALEFTFGRNSEHFLQSTCDSYEYNADTVCLHYCIL